MPCSLAECGKWPSGAPLAGSSQLQGISTARGIPPKLHQSDSSDHNKRQFELNMRLGQSRISNYTACSAGSFVSSAVYQRDRTVCSVNPQANYWCGGDISPWASIKYLLGRNHLNVYCLRTQWSCSLWMWSWSSSCGRQTVDQFVWVSGLPLGPLTRFYLVLLFSADKYLILLSKASSLTRKRVCSLQCNHSLVPITILYRLIW
jgi:hypothetical protein